MSEYSPSYAQSPQPNPDLLVRAGLDPEAIANAGIVLAERDLADHAQEPVPLNPAEAVHLDDSESTPVLGVVNAADVPVRVIGINFEGRMVPDVIFLAMGGYEEQSGGDNVSKLKSVMLDGEIGSVTRFGRGQKYAHELGLDNPRVSRNHFSVTRTPTGWLFLDDQSTHGTSLITGTERPMDATQ